MIDNDNRQRQQQREGKFHREPCREKLNGRLAMLAFAYFCFRESPLAGEDKTLAIDVVQSAVAVAKDSISLDFKSVLSAAGLALSLLVLSHVVRFPSGLVPRGPWRAS